MSKQTRVYLSVSFLQVRHAFAIMLVCASLLPLIASGANYAASAIQVNQVETRTVTVGSSVVTFQGQRQQLINSAFKVISTTGTNLHCEFWTLNFTGSQGQLVTGNFTSTIALNFYIVQDSSYKTWLNEGSCGNASDAVTSQLSTMGYSFSAILPSSGSWDIILVNLSNSRDADGFMSAYLGAGGYTTTEQLLGTTTVTSALTSAATTTPTTSIPGFPVESMAFGMVAGLVALMILRLRKTRSSE
jgi:hypothetical protein